MLSQQDYNGYLKQVLDIEKEMSHVYETCVDLTADEEVRKVCSKLMKQEKEHIGLVGELMKLLGVSA